MRCVLATLGFLFWLGLPGMLATASVPDDPGKGPGRLTEIHSIAWSPNGRELVFATNRGYENTVDPLGGRPSPLYLWRVRADGTDLVQITFPGGQAQHRDANPHWSPDGRRVAFDSDRDPADTRHGLDRLRQIFICDSDGRNLTQITDAANDRSSREPCWSPDGRRLVWVTNGPSHTGLTIADDKGKEIAWIRTTSTGRVAAPGTDRVLPSDPCWTRDGGYVVYRTTRLPGGAAATRSAAPPGGLAVHAVLRAGTPDRAPPAALVAFAHEVGLTGGACSPRDSRVAFVARMEGHADVWLSMLDGSGLRPITSLRDIGLSANSWVTPAWAPDGRTVAFVAPTRRSLPQMVREDGIWLCQVADGTVRELPIPPVDGH